MKHAVKRQLQKVTAVFLLSVILFVWSIPVCAEESTKPEEPTREVMDKAYDEAMMQVDSEITFYIMEEVNYQLALLMKYASGKMTAEDHAELKDPETTRLLDPDELIALSDSFIKESEIQADLTEYENAVSSWKEYIEGLPADMAAASAEEYYEQLPLESRADYLKAAYNVDNAVWTVLTNSLGDILSEAADLIPDVGTRIEEGAEVISNVFEEGAEVVSNVFSLIDEIRTTVSTGADSARYEKRIDLQKISTNFTLMEQMLQIVCNTIEALPS